MIDIKNVYEEFRLPIDFCKNKTNTGENLYNDLELLDNKDNYDYENDDEKTEANEDVSENDTKVELDEENIEKVLENTLHDMVNMRKNYKKGDRSMSLEEIKKKEIEAKNKLQKILKNKIKETFFGNNKKKQDVNSSPIKETKNDEIENFSVYNTLLKPKSDVGKGCLLPWSSQYTTDVGFLRDSQKLYSSMSDIQCQPDLVQNTWDMWRNIKNDNSFLVKYNYVDISFIKWMNKSSQLLFILTIYNISSPVINLLSPLAIFIMPFIIMKIMNVKMNWSNYKDILKKELKKKGLGRMISALKDASWNKRIYLAFCIFMYVFNIYQNVQSCRQFHRNMKNMTHNYNTLRDYCDLTIGNMNYFLSKSENLETYSIFNEKLKYYRGKLVDFRKKIADICNKNLSLKTVKEIGTIMRNLYDLYDAEDIEKLMLYSVGFNGYFETIAGIRENMDSGALKTITIVEHNEKENNENENENKKKKNKKKKKDKKNKPILNMKKMYHPSIQLQNENTKIIKNDIKLKKNRIITGPNAAGKTTLLKAVTVNLLITQQIGMGFYKSGKITPFDKIHCYINIPDTGSRDSLFQAEARRCVKILNDIKSTPDKKHFCIFDELFSGTNPYEAIGSAHAYLSFISNNPNVKFLLTTHFIKLCDLFKKHKTIDNYNMETNVVNNEPKYTYKLIKGISKTKGGIFVLKDLEYPEEILNSAQNRINEI